MGTVRNLQRDRPEGESPLPNDDSAEVEGEFGHQNTRAKIAFR